MRFKFDPRYGKTCFSHMRLTKAQISPRIRNNTLLAKPKIIGEGNNRPSLHLMVDSYVCMYICMYVYILTEIS